MEHHTAKCSGKESGYKPIMIFNYNHMKGGVNSIDQMVAHLSSQRGTRCWPLSFFMCLLDIAALNAYVVWLECNGIKPTRASFLQTLSLAMVKDYAANRAQNLHGNLVLMNSLVVCQAGS